MTTTRIGKALAAHAVSRAVATAAIAASANPGQRSEFSAERRR